MWIDRRALIAGIGASLLLNVFLLGFVVDHLFVGGRRPNAASSGRLVSPASVRMLTPDDRRSFSAAMTSHHTEVKAAREAHRAARLAAVEDIAAGRFDRDKVSADLYELRRSNMAVQQAVNAALLDALDGLSPQARAALVAHDSAGKAAPLH